MTPSRLRSPLARFLRVLTVILLAVAAAHTALWFWATGRLETGFADWLAQQRAAGWRIEAAAPGRGGWPGAAAIEIPSLTMSGGEADLPGGLTWHAEGLRLSLPADDPQVLRIEAAGGQRLRIEPAPEIGIAGKGLYASVPLNPAGSATLSGRGVRLTLPDGPMDIATLSAHADTRPAAGPGATVLALTGSAEAITLPPAPHGKEWALGPRIASISFDADLSGPLPALPDLTARARAWRDGGGSLEVPRLALGWGPLGLLGEGKFTLDANLQPTGAGKLQLVGYEATLDALAKGGVVAARAAQAAKGVLGILARAPEGGGTPRVELPLEIKDSTLAVGRFPLARVPQWVWPP